MQSATNAVANSASNFSNSTSYIGQDSLGGRFFTGDIDEMRIYSNSLSMANIASLAAVTPTVAAAAAASPSMVTGKTTNLSVLGADAAGESSLNYTWSATGPAAVAFSVNGTNAAKNTTATFTKPGTYSFTVTMIDALGQTTTSTVNVTVNQTPAITVSPGPLNMAANGTQTFSVAAVDQFGTTLNLAPWTWSATSGTINSSTGAYTSAGGSHADVTITATSGSYGRAPPWSSWPTFAPTVATAAAASPSPVTGTSTALSVLGSDERSGGEPHLFMVDHSRRAQRPRPRPTRLSANGTNAALKHHTPTFSQAGAYTLQATITDAGGLTTTSSVNVTVSQTLTSVALTPGIVSLASHAAQQFTATGYDQFGASDDPRSPRSPGAPQAARSPPPDFTPRPYTSRLGDDHRADMSSFTNLTIANTTNAAPDGRHGRRGRA